MFLAYTFPSPAKQKADISPICITMASHEVVLLDLQASPFAMRVRVALAEKEVEFESREEDLPNKSSLLLQMNPVRKQLPVLIHKGKPICESLVIVEYIDEVWNHKSPLLPLDPYQRAHARFWGDYIDKKIYPNGSKLYLSGDPEVRKSSVKELIDSLKVLEVELGDKSFFGGEIFGFVDVALIPFYSYFYTFEMLGNLSMEAECPKLVAWGKRCMQKSTVSKTLCDHHKVYQRILWIKKMLGFE